MDQQNIPCSSQNHSDTLMDPDFTDNMDRLKAQAAEHREQIIAVRKKIKMILKNNPDRYDQVQVLQYQLVRLLKQNQETLREIQTKLGIPDLGDLEDVFFDSLNCELETSNAHGGLNTMNEIENIPENYLTEILDSKDEEIFENYIKEIFDNEEFNDQISDDENDLKCQSAKYSGISCEGPTVHDCAHDINMEKNVRFTKNFDDVVHEIAKALNKDNDMEMKEHLQATLDNIKDRVYKKRGTKEEVEDAKECEELTEIVEDFEVNESIMFDTEECEQSETVCSHPRDTSESHTEYPLNVTNENTNDGSRDLVNLRKKLEQEMDSTKKKEDELVDTASKLQKAKDDNAALLQEIHEMERKQSILASPIRANAKTLDILENYEDKLNIELQKIRETIEETRPAKEKIVKTVQATSNERFYDLHLFNNFENLIENPEKFIEDMRKYKYGKRGNGNARAKKDAAVMRLEMNRFSQDDIRQKINNLNKKYDTMIAKHPRLKNNFGNQTDLEEFGNKMQKIVEKEMKV